MQDPRAKLSTDLVALLADNYVPAQQLLKRIFPPGLLMYLAQRRLPAAPRGSAARDSEQVSSFSGSHLMHIGQNSGSTYLLTLDLSGAFCAMLSASCENSADV